MVKFIVECHIHEEVEAADAMSAAQVVVERIRAAKGFNLKVTQPRGERALEALIPSAPPLAVEVV